MGLQAHVRPHPRQLANLLHATRQNPTDTTTLQNPLLLHPQHHAPRLHRLPNPRPHLCPHNHRPLLHQPNSFTLLPTAPNNTTIALEHPTLHPPRNAHSPPSLRPNSKPLPLPRRPARPSQRPKPRPQLLESPRLASLLRLAALLPRARPQRLVGNLLAPDDAVVCFRTRHGRGGCFGACAQKSGSQGDCAVQRVWAERVCAHGPCAAGAVVFGRGRECGVCERVYWGVLLGAGCGDVGGGCDKEGSGEGYEQGGEGDEGVVVVESGTECYVVVCVVLLLYAFAWRGWETVGVVEALVGAGQFGERGQRRGLDCLGVFVGVN